MLRYPNGKRFKRGPKQKNQGNKNIHFGNRGMTLEKEINVSNEYYLQIGKAVIHKKPTPVQIVNVDYPKRSAAVITEAYFKLQATTDYNGVYRGKYIDFEAKETRSRTSFPLNNFHSHQVEHMKNVVAQGGLCFVIIKFVQLDHIYLLQAKEVFHFWDEMSKGGRKSIPFDFIKDKGVMLPYGFRPRIDYLSVIDKIYFDK